MKLFIDSRESFQIKYYLDEMLNADITYEITTLNSGDFVFAEDDGRVICVIERKSIGDWAASIKDGRIKEQSKRFNETVAMYKYVKFFFLIEDRYPDNICTICTFPKETINQSIMSMVVKKGITVLNTKSIKETVLFLNRIWKSLNGDKIDFGGIETPLMLEMLPKKAGIRNPTDLLANQLACIPGLGKGSASAIAMHFKTMSNLVIHFNVKGKGGLQGFRKTEKSKVSENQSIKIAEFLGVLC